MKGRVVIVGGPIVGLSSALALARAGANVTVLERSDLRALDIGGGLGVDVDLIQQITGVTSAPPVCRGVDRETTAWQLLRDWLEECTTEVDAIELRSNVNVTSVADEHDGALVTSSTGEEWRADVVVGADGVHSTVRPFVDPERPKASYAGFVLWRAMVSEELVKGVAKLLPADLGAELQAIAEHTWPSPWAEALDIAIEQRIIFGTPVAEYMPDRLVNGRVAIAGDSAHAASPMVGGGFTEGLNDAARLAKSFASSSDGVRMLASYEKARLGPGR